MASNTPEPAPPVSGEELYSIESQMNRVEQEKREALLDPGPTWREWWFYSGSKWYVGLGFIIIEVWIFGTFAEVGLYLLAVPVMLVAAYLECLLYLYLYYVPPISYSTGTFRRTWYRPVEYGRWTPEGEALRAGGRVESPGGPDPRQIL